MNKTTMRARVTDQHMLLVNEPLIASGGVDEIKIYFEFCSLWDGCGKTAVFYRDPETVYHVPIADGVVTVPYEVLAEAGSFYFGVMGSASNIRTTEVLRVEVVQGAITEATNVPDTPTPDIYQQLLASYGKAEEALAVERARIDELAAMRGHTGEKTFNAYMDEKKHAVQIVSNGVSATISVSLGSVSSGYDYSFLDIPAEFAPVNPGVIMGSDKVRVVFGVSEGKVILRILATADDSSAVYADSYPLANPYIDELGDIRVGADGETYSTAGEAVRGQFQSLSDDVQSLRDTASIQQLLIEAEIQTRAEADAKHEIIDDTVSGNPWSSKNIVEKLCPTFEESGSAVTCEPVEGYPLEVVSTIPVTEQEISSLTLYRVGKNIYDNASYPLTSGRWISKVHGSDIGDTNTGFCCTKNYIPISHLRGKTIMLNHIPTRLSNAGMAFYDADKAFISGSKGYGAIVPDAAVYMRFTVDAIYADGKDVQIEIGDTATPYEPYRCDVFTADFSNLIGRSPSIVRYDWNTGIVLNEDGDYHQHDLATGEFHYISEIENYAVQTVRNLPANAGVNTLYCSEGTTAVKGRKDPKAMAENLSNQASKQYELIEDFTLTEEAATISCPIDTEGNPYNFEAVRVITEIPACGGDGVNHQVVLVLKDFDKNTLVYFGLRDGIKAADDRSTAFVARNDRGLVELYATTENTTRTSSYATVYSNPYHCEQVWRNICYVNINLSPASLVFPAGTKVRIYAIRG